MFKIDFYLKSPLCFTDPITFDALLAYCFVAEMYQGDVPQALNYNEIIDFAPMPLQIVNNCFAGSVMHYKDDIEKSAKWVKRWDNVNDDLVDFGKKKAGIEIAKGEFKNYRMPIPIHYIDKVWFYFETNNLDSVTTLISRWLRGIGKKISQGYGMIEKYEVIQVTDKDFNFSNYLLRPVPTEFLKEGMALNSMKKGYKLVMTNCGYKPPYWLPGNRAKCSTVVFE